MSRLRRRLNGALLTRLFGPGLADFEAQRRSAHESIAEDEA